MYVYVIHVCEPKVLTSHLLTVLDTITHATNNFYSYWAYVRAEVAMFPLGLNFTLVLIDFI